MESIDRLLEDLKAKYEQNAAPSAAPGAAPSAAPNEATASPAPNPSPPSVPGPILPTSPPRSLEDLLAGLGEERQQHVRDTLLAAHSAPPLPQPDLFSSPISSPATPAVRGWPTSPPLPPPSDDPLVNDLKSHYEAQDRAEALKHEQAAQAAQREQQRLAAEQRRQAQIKQQRLAKLKAQRRAELAEQAQEWLRKMKPKSAEGRWFAEFACNYESPLEAAIEYLDALHDLEASSSP